MKGIGLNEIRSAIATLAAIVSVAILPWSCWRSDLVRTLLKEWLAGRAEQFTQGWEEIDRDMSAAAGDGNVAVRFINFNPESLKSCTFAQTQVFRAAYALYPRRVLASEPQVIVNSGRDLLASRFDPPLPWLRQRNVRSVVKYTVLSDGQLLMRVEPVPAEGEGK